MTELKRDDPHSFEPSASSETPITGELCLGILIIARRSARDVGLTAESVEDCAMEFLVHMLEDDGRRLKRAPPPPDFFPWIRRCARNFACNTIRSQVAVARRQETMLLEILGRGSEELLPSALDRESHRREFWSLIRSSIAALDCMHQELLFRFYIFGLSVEELAGEMDRTPHAVEQTLFRARKRLRAELVRRGIDQEDLLAYL